MSTTVKPGAARVAALPHSASRRAALAVAGSLLIAVSAQLAAPMWPVPMTMQTLAVLLVGATLGARLGAFATLLYLAEGAAGLPVFSGFAAGPAAFAGPTAGYLLAFPAAAFLAGWAADRGLARRARTAIAPMAAGTLVILCVGTLWLGVIVSSENAMAAGFWPFVPGAALKIALAAALAPSARALVGRFAN